jgi:hypothetical protein
MRAVRLAGSPHPVDPGRDHRVEAADRPADAIKIAGDLTRQISGGLIEEKDLLRDESIPTGLDVARTPDRVGPRIDVVSGRRTGVRARQYD